jgi:hypothetical protein
MTGIRNSALLFLTFSFGLWSSVTKVYADTHTAASASYADVNAAVSAASRGDTVLVPGGSATWSSPLSLTKGISLKGAGQTSTIITGSGVLIAIAPDATAIANEETIHVEGFTFDGNNTALNLITVRGSGVNDAKPFRNLAVGNNTFRNTGTVTSGSGVISSMGQVRGVIYNNIFDRVNVVLKIMGNDDPTEWANGYFPFAYGNSDNLFFEGNTVQFSLSFSGEDPGWTETGQGGRLVKRYNTWNMANTKQQEVWDIHGFQNWPNGQTGTMISEYYGNTITNSSGYRWINHRGSWGMFFDNIMIGNNMGIEADQYVGCTSDVPGSTGVYRPEINNTYVFNNTTNGTMQNMVLGTEQNCGIAENSNWWNYNPSFNGATGIGRGATAPTGSCMVGTGYWAASTPTPTTDPNVIQKGTFYKCTATNVWTAYYTPYTYPHPLREGILDSTPPAAPKNLKLR